MVNKVNNARPPIKFASALLHALAFFSLPLNAMLILLAVAVFLLAQPKHLIPVLENQLQAQGFSATIHALNATLDWPSYRVKATVSGSGHGIDMADARVSTALDLRHWLNKTQKMQSLTITLPNASVDLATLQSALNADDVMLKSKQQASKQPGKLSGAVSAYLPAQWSVTCLHCDINSPHYHYVGELKATGQGKQNATLLLNDQHGNDLSVVYQGREQPLRVSSQSFDARHLTDYPVSIKNLSATIPLNNIWQSQATASVYYQTRYSDITLTGNGENQLRLLATTSKTPVALTAVRTDNQVTLTMPQLDLAVIKPLKAVAMHIMTQMRPEASQETYPTTMLPPQLLQSLSALKGSGQVGATAIVSMDTQYAITALQSLALTLSDVSANDGEHGISHLSGEIHYALNAPIKWNVSLNQTQIDLPEAYPDGLAALTGEISGQFDLATQTVTLHNAKLHNEDFDTLQATMTLQFQPELIMDLSAEVSHLSLGRFKHYLPQQFPPKTKSWLSKALRSGKDNHTRVRIHGDLNQFLDDENFVFNIQSDIRDGVLRYKRDNPDIAMQDVQLSIDHKRLSVAVNKAQLFTNSDEKTHSVPLTGTVVIADMNQAEVDIDAQISSQPLAKLMRIAERSIVQKSLKKVKKIVKAAGQFSINVQLLIDAYRDNGGETFTVQLQGEQASATLNDYPNVTVKNATADILVNDDGLQSLRLSGQALKQPIRVALTQLDPTAKVRGFDIDVEVKRANPLVWLPRFNLLQNNQAKLIRQSALFAGKSDYSVNVKLTEAGELIQVSANSQLENAQANVFQLLQKSAKKKLTLALNYRQRNRELTIALGKNILVKTGFNAKGQMHSLVLDNQQRKTPLKQGVGRITWQGEAFDYIRFRQFQSAWDKTTKAQKPVPIDYRLGVSFDHFMLNESTTVPLEINGSLSQMQIASPLLSGKLAYRGDHLQAQFSRLEAKPLIDLVAKDSVNPEGREVTQIDFATALPTLDITAEQIIYQGNNIGNAVIKTSKRSGNYSIDQILLSGQHYYLDASGYEAVEPQGVVTKLQADFKGEQLREVIQLFKLNDMLDAQFVDVSANLAWPGKAHTLNLRQSYGSARLTAQDVRLVEISSSAGSVFGMMDIAGILRRIALDFENVSSGNLTFDRVDGQWNIGGGRAITRDAYALGSVVDLAVVGAADLHRRVFDDVDVQVIPKASNVFPIIGAVAGGVAGVAIGMVVQQAVGSNINKAVGLPYVISGQWENPTVTFVGNGADDNAQN